jgi:hypothetical protein
MSDPSKQEDVTETWQISALRFCAALVDAGVIDSYVLGSIDNKPTTVWVKSGPYYVEYDMAYQQVVNSTADTL